MGVDGVELHPAAVRFVREEAPLGHLVTLDEDGSPHVTVAWFDVREGRLVMATLFDQRKLRNLRRDPRATVSFEGPGTNAVGMQEHLVVDGVAELSPGGAPELLQELAHRHIGPDAVFPPIADPPPGWLTWITPTRARGIGPWADD